MSMAALIVAAGRGTRAGAGLPKQWRDLAGRPMVAHALGAFRAAPAVTRLALVLHPDDIGQMPQIEAMADLVVPGGASRAASVRAGLEALEAEAPRDVLIHDAARPLVPAEVIARVADALQAHEAAAPGLPLTDALWREVDGAVSEAPDRGGLWRAQTPQGFRFAPILAAHQTHDGSAADDVAVARMAGMEVRIVQGDERNMKITGPQDFARAEALAAAPLPDIRVGNGYDVHRFGEGDHVMLCGVAVPFDRGLSGHSDADVGMHALTDAIFGALASGDIGQHFPPSDPQWKGAESHIFLTRAVELAREQGFALTHADVTLICEQPKIGPHAQAMRSALAGILGVPEGRVSVKATTSERLGFTGRGEGIAAQATATLVRP
ncbi:bifunctional 2-C-methyl-D-erythritol 4-phosphate cytidylyltransferase/2-C-methyl-D-erythritol 2,4-cyclodiphosphate synthase [Pseudoroseicyclus aestuarii]|uniref:Bifunctional enzyme IspD/IspF n=1 Tax=Pseudoroseicyclus aestuarii TaxID=1795041 RepID=A0A318SMV7_9RHOB|nr:bifunctional 2-C-methyl-D-erythritol 4-phosphate cytidylyltransferase/2-C-methyl-D-erythritol 2,4-cyclodiphosphate synthase [Pseudoroseicyclus aestuarii]PYE81182.1 2-C-methyl-D-erythritol 2,4-cyclodiphosphate synthase [Pseudoroseicyclus aestuarii]